MARSVGGFSGCLTSGMGPEGGGSSAIGNGVMSLISPFGGPVSSAMVPLIAFCMAFCIPKFSNFTTVEILYIKANLSIMFKRQRVLRV